MKIIKTGHHFGISLLFIYLFINISFAQEKSFTRADTLRGSITHERAWWDVLRYDITVKPDIQKKSITGTVVITFESIFESTSDSAQIDLQDPLVIDSILTAGKRSTFRKEGSFYHVHVPVFHLNDQGQFKIYYHGTPHEAEMPPWFGGWIWAKDSLGRPWVTVACQGLGASSWYPCKDHQSDEPDNGASLTIIVPNELTAVGNGKLSSTTKNTDGTMAYKWEVVNPINNYDIVPYIGYYKNFSEIYDGEKGDLSVNYWALDYNMERMKTHSAPEVQRMLKAFEYWMGPYPFYEDGYKLIEAPHLGMEHQSAIAYGNKFMQGYSGKDLSRTGQGLKWDYIIVHESGHEWFGNNITSKDIADMWIHEGFTTYSETLFTEFYFGKEAAQEYNTGQRVMIKNDKPVIGNYNVNSEGSGDQYAKISNMINIIRKVIDNDSLFRNILRGLNQTFYHKTVTSNDIQSYISDMAGYDFSKIFTQYLNNTQVPQLSYYKSENKLYYKLDSCIAGLNLPIKIIKNNTYTILSADSEWKILNEPDLFDKEFIEKNYYIKVKENNEHI